jgi:hypothetical protein
MLQAGSTDWPGFEIFRSRVSTLEYRPDSCCAQTTCEALGSFSLGQFLLLFKFGRERRA